MHQVGHPIIYIFFALIDLLFDLASELIPILIGIVLVKHKDFIKYVGKLVGQESLKAPAITNNVIANLLVFAGVLMVLTNGYDMFQDFGRFFSKFRIFR